MDYGPITYNDPNQWWQYQCDREESPKYTTSPDWNEAEKSLGKVNCYRFIGQAGTQMSEEAVEQNHCNTFLPGHSGIKFKF